MVGVTVLFQTERGGESDATPLTSQQADIRHKSSVVFFSCPDPLETQYTCTCTVSPKSQFTVCPADNRNNATTVLVIGC